MTPAYHSRSERGAVPEALRRSSVAPRSMLPLQLLAAWLAVWFARALQRQVDYFMAEKRVLICPLHRTLTPTRATWPNSLDPFTVTALQAQEPPKNPCLKRRGARDQ